MQPFMIGIAGPSGAGKSVFCQIMQKRFQGVTRLKLDDFFIDIDQIPKYKDWLDWDRPDAIKWELLIAAAKDLKKGKPAMVPNYSRLDNRAIGEKCVFSSEIILVDGFMTLLHPDLRDLLDLKIFFRLSEDSQLKRRKERQPWVEEGYLHEVMLPAARKYIMPSAAHADHVINAELTKYGLSERCISLIESHLSNRMKRPVKNTRVKSFAVL